MQINRHVIIDLLPLYLADELSEETRKLVESYLSTDPALAKLAEQARQTTLPNDIPQSREKDAELKSFEKSKALMRQRTLFMAIAIFFTGLMISFRFDGSSVVWLLNDSPGLGLIFFTLAIIGWTGYAISVSKLSVGKAEALQKQRRVFLFLAIFCTVALGAFRFVDGLIQWLWINTPGIAYMLFFFAAWGWIGYGNILRELSQLDQKK